MKKMVRMVCLVCVMIMSSVMLTSCVGVLAPTLKKNVEKSRLQRDKSVLAEIRQSIITTLEDEKYQDAEASSMGAKVGTDGSFNIEDLFDSENEYNYDIAEKVSSEIGSNSVQLKSKLSEDCTIKIYMDARGGTVVIQAISDEFTFYISDDGENEGEYRE